MPRSVDSESFGFLVTDLSRLIRSEFDRRIAATGLGLTAGEARVLVHAARAGAVRQTVLADAMGVEAMTISTFIDRLEAQGYVRRIADPVDRRAKLIELTSTADELLPKIKAIATAIRETAAQTFDPADWEALMAGLKRARATLLAVREARFESSAA